MNNTPPTPRHERATPGNNDANIVTGPAPGGCPDPGWIVRRCAHWHCKATFHIDVNRGGQRRRFCSARCRVAEHRRLNH